PSSRQKEDYKIDNISQIYPEYYILRVNKFNDIAKNSLDEWIYFLKNEVIEDRFKAKGLKEAIDALDILKLDKKGRALFNRREENKMYKVSLLYSAKAEGERVGEIKGKLEEKIEIAKNLLKAKIDIDTIVLSTGLNIEEIEKFIKD
ncbi:MAG: hypothetical protein QM493_00825, partial [Sulfurovum sp.]